jgi:hypothetical protein
MSRIRTIKPDFFIDEDVAKLKPLTRILFTGLWCLADKAGRLEDRPQRIKIQILPYDNIDIDAALDDLNNAAFIIRYTADDQKLIQIRSFQKHQRPHHTEKDSEFPPYNGEVPVKYPLSDGEEKVGKERKGKERKGTYICSTEFLKFYEAYPRKVGKEPAWKAWKKRNGDRPDIETLLKILEEQKRSDQWQKEGGQFVPLPATWINQGRWDDKLEEKGGIQSWLETTSQE